MSNLNVSMQSNTALEPTLKKAIICLWRLNFTVRLHGRLREVSDVYNLRKMEIQELKSEDELQEAFPIMQELRSKVDEQEYFCLLEDMVKEGYRLFALRDFGVIVALAGVAVLTNLSYGRHVWVYDLITTSNARSKGHGRRLLEFVEEFAHQENCKVVALSSGLERTSAHRFYEKYMNYEKTSYVFKKNLL